MLRKYEVSGDKYLLYPITEMNPLQNFHIGMITTHPELPLVPFNCRYVEGVEALEYQVQKLIPVREALENNKALSLSSVFCKLGNALQVLMEYQLMPENILLDENHIYVDYQYEQILVTYIPVRNPLTNPRESLTCLMMKWMDEFFDETVNEIHPMYIQLLLKQKMEQTGYRQLIEVMTREYSTPHYRNNSFKQTNDVKQTSIQYDKSENDSKGELSQIARVAMEKSESKINVEKVNDEPSLKYKIKRVCLKSMILLFGSFASLLIILMLSFDFNTKLGLALIVMAISIYGQRWLNQRCKWDREIKSVSKDVQVKVPLTKDKCIIDSEHKSFQEHEPLIPKEDHAASVLSKDRSDDTVLLKSGDKNAVLMVRNPNGIKYFNVTKELTSIGRNPNLCDLIIDDVSIGRVHAEIHMNQGSYFIKDMKSLNGTYVNGSRITSNQYVQLKSGDLIKMGTREAVFS